MLQRATLFICRVSRDTGYLLRAKQVLWDYYCELASAIMFSMIDLQTAEQSQTGEENVYFAFFPQKKIELSLPFGMTDSKQYVCLGKDI